MLGGCVKQPEPDSVHGIYDRHVHLMSPALIADWKAMGIPFSRAEAHYSDIDTILGQVQARHVDLVGMGYVFANPDYYQGEDPYGMLKQENDHLLAAAGKYPQRVRPFIAVDPLQDYCREELERCLRINPAIGLKVHHSASQVYLTEPEHLRKVRSLMQKAAENGVPVLMHFDNWHPKFGKPDLELLVDSILQQIPPVSLRIAHFGTSGGFNQKTKTIIDTFLELKAAGRIPQRHEVKFDISAVALDKDSEGVQKLAEEEFRELAAYVRKLGVENIVFGTDYPLYSSDAYIRILKERVGLTDAEIAKITAAPEEPSR